MERTFLLTLWHNLHEDVGTKSWTAISFALFRRASSIQDEATRFPTVAQSLWCTWNTCLTTKAALSMQRPTDWISLPRAIHAHNRHTLSQRLPTLIRTDWVLSCRTPMLERAWNEFIIERTILVRSLVGARLVAGVWGELSQSLHNCSFGLRLWVASCNR